MEVKKVTKNTRKPTKDDDKESMEQQKKRLKQQINDLRSLISEVEHNLEITKFRDVANKQELLRSPPENRSLDGAPNLFVQFTSEMYKFAGFHCVKLTNTESVFNFTSLNENGSIETFSIEILINDDNASVGKWVLPMSMVLTNILLETPIDGLSTVVPFLRNCKRHIDCYTQRKKQFSELKVYTLDMRNIEISANMGFTVFNLRLLEVYNKTTDSFVILTINLSYKSDETRSSTINVDWSKKKIPSAIEEKAMKSYTKFFRHHNMMESFRRMIETEHSMFTWVVEKDTILGLELSNSSESEDESVFVKAKAKRKRIMTNRQKNQDVKKRWRQRQKESIIVRRLPRKNTTEDKTESEESTNKLEDSSLHDKLTEELEPNVRNEESTKNRKRELRQSTLNFQISAKETVTDNQEKDVNEKTLKLGNSKAATKTKVAKSKIPVAKEKKIVQTISKKSSKPTITSIEKIFKANLAMTSTPLTKSAKSRVRFLPTSDAEISPISE